MRPDPDRDTVRALEQLGAQAIFSGSPDADRLTTEALTLGQALGVDAAQLGDLFVNRALFLGMTDRVPQAAAYLREAVRLAAQADDSVRLGGALLNLAGTLTITDPAAGADAARTAAGHLRRAGAQDLLAWAIGNLAEALMILGDWSAAEEELTLAADSDGLAEHEQLAYLRAWGWALAGDAAAAEPALAAIQDAHVSEDVQDQAQVSVVQAFIAAARRQPADALRYARRTLAHADVIGISHNCMCWAWPLAARSAWELRDAVTAEDLLRLLDSYLPGQLAPMLRAERDLVRARLIPSDGDHLAAAFADAITSLRKQSTPFHLAHGLLDHADYLTRSGDADVAAAAVKEARDIGRRLRCQPLLDRADAVESARPRIQA